MAHRGFIANAFAAVLLLTVACAPPPVGVQGQVTYLGETVADGAIRFFPIEGTAGAGAATAIRDGAYRFAPEDGLTLGKYRVEITAAKETGREVPRIEVDPGESPTMRESIQYVPACYNVDSVLQVELTGRTQEESFHLQDRKSVV